MADESAMCEVTTTVHCQLPKDHKRAHHQTLGIAVWDDAEQPKDSAPKLSKAQRDAIHEWLDFSFQHPSDEALDAATESLASAIEGASATVQAQSKDALQPGDMRCDNCRRVIKFGDAAFHRMKPPATFCSDRCSHEAEKAWPERIYLQTGENERPPYDECGEITWCSEKIDEGDVEYIRADLTHTEQALHPALQQLYERYDLAMKRVGESGLDKRPYWSGEATGLEIAINLLGGTTDDR